MNTGPMLNLVSMMLATAGLFTIPTVQGADNGKGRSGWHTVVNQNDIMPGAPEGQTFNSFNQPSVNARGIVTFRARSRGGSPGGHPLHGIFARDMARGAPAFLLADTLTPVPDPNNAGTDFNEFPAFPRIAMRSANIATRGNHPPVWVYADTRAGTTGIYARLSARSDNGDLVTGAAKLGAVPGFEFLAVPGYLDPLSFDVFPGAPAITDDGVIAFKGNYTDNTAKTGVFFRQLDAIAEGGATAVMPIANSGTELPEPGRCAPGTRFGSTAPPSAVSGSLVFVGLDDEEQPTCGGLYRAPMAANPAIKTLVSLETEVPGSDGQTFNRLGEALSYDGRFVTFWGAWGDDRRTLQLKCPREGNQDRIAYCLQAFGDDYEVEVPAHQGIFLLDIRRGLLSRIADNDTNFSGFLYWNFSGRVPGGGGEDDGEFARWRASSFAAVSGSGGAARVVFKAHSDNGAGRLDGLYMVRRPGQVPMQTLLQTGMPGDLLDTEAPAGAPITEIGLERDGYRGNWLAISAKMAVEGEIEDGMAGIYVIHP
ncbi:MAG: hypothetical protein HWE39_05770 [Oceanospirillaceae bacterium]|nr:hypothetical protein [Oceanospirillaceae bacterium]